MKQSHQRRVAEDGGDVVPALLSLLVQGIELALACGEVLITESVYRILGVSYILKRIQASLTEKISRKPVRIGAYEGMKVGRRVVKVLLDIVFGCVWWGAWLRNRFTV